MRCQGKAQGQIPSHHSHHRNQWRPQNRRERQRSLETQKRQVKQKKLKWVERMEGQNSVCIYQNWENCKSELVKKILCLRCLDQDRAQGQILSRHNS